MLAAWRQDRIALSAPVFGEITEVLSRPRLARFVTVFNRDQVLVPFRARATWFEPTVSVTECHDPKDDKYLKPALAANASVIVTGDADLLDMDPWRRIRILRPAEYLLYAP